MHVCVHAYMCIRLLDMSMCLCVRVRVRTGRIGSRQQVPVLGPVVAWGSSKGAWGFSVGRLDLKQLGFQGKPLF